MKRKGILFTILVIVMIIAIIVGVFVLLFAISNFEINYTSLSKNLDKVKFEEYIYKNYKGKNQFIFNKDKFISDVEKEFPYSEIVDVERVFPKKVNVTVCEREDVFTILFNSKYYVFDNRGVLLEIKNDNIEDVGDYPCIEIFGMSKKDLEGIDEYIGQVPDKLESNKKFNCFMKYINIMERLEYNYTDTQLKKFITSIEVNEGLDLTIHTESNTTMIIYNFPTQSEGKVKNIIGAFVSGMATEPSDILIIGDDLLPVIKKSVI